MRILGNQLDVYWLGMDSLEAPMKGAGLLHYLRYLVVLTTAWENSISDINVLAWIDRGEGFIRYLTLLAVFLFG